MRWPAVVVLGLILLSTACAGSGPGAQADGGQTDGGQSNGDQLSGQVVVFAASSLTESFGKLGREFERAHPGVRVTFSFGGSDSLGPQIVA
ncbi:MAG: molybdate ABC transporter substrate-binding protein, partial [Nocardioidaceae bacterium]